MRGRLYGLDYPVVVANALAVMVAATGVAMLVPAAYALLANDGNARAFGLPAIGAVALGTVLFFLTRRPGRGYVSRQDVFFIVISGWVAITIVGALPFYLSGLMGPTDAFFNSMAGFTTTGAATEVPEAIAPSLLLWRSLEQWIGGIGIIVLFVAVAPLVGFGSSQLYSAEIATPVPERMTPRIRDTAKILAYVYGGLTLGGIVALQLAGMGPFDAVNHTLTTVSTGGYSTHSDSIAAFDSWAVELAIVAGMVLSGTNFALYYTAAQGQFGRAVGNRELLTYLGVIASATILMTASLYAFDYQDSLILAFREALFQSASLTTGTAFASADWNAWGPFSQAILVTVMAFGGCAGSTSGGIKMIRIYILASHFRQQILRMVHPSVVTPLNVGQRTMPEQLRVGVLGFFFVYMATLIVGTLLMTLHQVPLGAAFGSVFACLNITGTFVGPAGNAEFYAELPATAKWTLTLFMLLGRLEIFTVLVVLSPTFWRS